MCAICTPVQICTRVLICSTEFAPPTKVEQISTRGCRFAPGCIFIKHRLYDQNTPQVQIYTPGVYLHRVVYCAYERGLRYPIILWNTRVRGGGVRTSCPPFDPRMYNGGLKKITLRSVLANKDI